MATTILRSTKTALSKLRIPKDITVNSLLYLIVFIAIFVYLLKINRAVYYFIFTSIIVVLYMVSADLSLSISVAGIATALIYVYVDSNPLKKRKSMLGKRYSVILEHLEDGNGDKPEEDASENKENEEDKTTSDIIDGEKAFPEKKDDEKDTKSKTKGKKEEGEKTKKKSSSVDKKEITEVFQTIMDEFEPSGSGKSEIDSKQSYLNMFKTMDEKEISTLNNDTKDLINTQKKLMETLETMGPALQQGKSILDTFKNYFGDEKKIKASLV